MKRWWVGLAGVLLVPSCAQPLNGGHRVVVERDTMPREYTFDLPRITRLDMDSVVMDWYGEIWSRYRDLETAFCMYGVVDTRGRMEHTFLRPAAIDSADDTHLWYSQGCPIPDPQVYGFLRYLGRLHNHPNGWCKHSAPDTTSLRREAAAIIDVIVCGRRNPLVAKVKTPRRSDSLAVANYK